MAELVMVLGTSGTGKSTSLRNLNPEETFVIQAAKKALPFKGWKKKFNESNLFFSKDYAMIKKTIKFINEKRPNIKQIVIDDSSYLLTDDFMKRIPHKATGGEVFEKYNEIGYNFYNLISMVEKLRDDLFVVFIAHTDTSDNGQKHFKVVGKMLTNMVVLEGKATYILESGVESGKYFFKTNSFDFGDIAKTPMGMFKEIEIENDLNMVLEKIKEYEGDE